METKGIFLYLDSINALDALKADAQKWRIVRAVTMYAVLGELPDEKMQNNSAFLFLKSMVDNGKNNLKRKKGGAGENKTKITIDSNSKTSFCGDKENRKSNDKHICCGEEKLEQVVGERITKTKNKTKTKNETKTKNSSSEVFESGESGNEIVGEEEEVKKKKIKLVDSPSLNEVQEFVSVTCVKVDPLCFYEYYKAKEWKIGGRSVVDWRACVLEWDRRERRKEVREKEREKSQKIRIYSKKQMDEVESSVLDLTTIDDVNALLN